LKRGDVLISSIGFGSIGKIQVFDKEGMFGTVSEVTVVRQNEFNPYYLAAFLPSQFGQMQIERYITGATGQLHLKPTDVERFYVPRLPNKQQLFFERINKEAKIAKAKALDLLEAAKRAVEIAIEDGERAALVYLAQTEAV
jgi:type I restriction enzyme, S subunit